MQNTATEEPQHAQFHAESSAVLFALCLPYPAGRFPRWIMRHVSFAKRVHQPVEAAQQDGKDVIDLEAQLPGGGDHNRMRAVRTIQPRLLRLQ